MKYVLPTVAGAIAGALLMFMWIVGYVNCWDWQAIIEDWRDDELLLRQLRTRL